MLLSDKIAPATQSVPLLAAVLVVAVGVLAVAMAMFLGAYIMEAGRIARRKRELSKVRSHDNA